MPSEGAKEVLAEELKALPFCEVISADNVDVLVLLIDTVVEKPRRYFLE